MDKLSSLVYHRMAHHDLDASARAAQVMERAKQWLLKAMPGCEAEVQPLKLQAGVLWVGVLSASHAAELRSFFPGLLRDLRLEFGACAVRSLRTKSLTER